MALTKYYMVDLIVYDKNLKLIHFYLNEKHNFKIENKLDGDYRCVFELYHAYKTHLNN